jgi:hypothetical protein
VTEQRTEEFPVSQLTPQRTTDQWEPYVARLNAQLPAAPAGLLDFYVAWAPWLAIVLGALGVLAWLGVLIGGAILSPLLVFAGIAGVKAGAVALLSGVMGLATSAAAVVGGYLMLNRRSTGWWLLAAGLVLNLLSGLISLSVLSMLVAVLIAYVHLQVRPRYT